MIKNLKRVIALTIIMLLMLSSVIFAADPNPNWINTPITHTIDGVEYSRNDANANSFTQIIDSANPLELSSAYNATAIEPSGVEIYEYKTTNKIQFAGSGSGVNDTGEGTDGYYLISKDSDGYNLATAYMNCPTNNNTTVETETFNNFATAIYKDCIEYNGKKYSIKLDINKVTKLRSEFSTGEQGAKLGKVAVGFSYGYIEGTADKSNLNNYATSSGTNRLNPRISFTAENNPLERSAVEIDVDVTILDSDGNESDVTGLFVLNGIGRTCGVLVKDYQINNTNSYMNKTDKDNFRYITKNNNSFAFFKYLQSNDNPTKLESSYPDAKESYQARLQMEDTSKVHLVLIGDGAAGGTTISFSSLNFTQKYQIVTNVKNGTTETPIVEEIEAGAEKTIKFSPIKAGQKVKSILVDGEPIAETITGNEVSYTFSNINGFHTLDVEYEPVPEETNPNDGNGTNNGTNPSEGTGTTPTDEKTGEYDKTTVTTGKTNVINAGNKVSNAVKDAEKDGKTEEITKNADKNSNAGSKNVAPNLGPQAGGKSLLVLIAAVIAITGFTYKKSKKYKAIK